MNPFVIKQLGKVQRVFDRWMERRAGEYIFPETVACQADIPYLDSGRDCHRMDLYRPRHGAGKLPVIVNFHGGGLLLCTRKVNRPFCAELAKRGVLVFCLDYPLVPEADVRGILSDTAAGMDRVRTMIEIQGGDLNRVFLVGDSAGAFLSVYQLAAQKEPEIARALHLNPTTLQVKAAAFISGMFYTARPDSVGLFLRKDFYGGDWKHDAFRPYADPAVPAVAGAMPPCWLATAKLDNLRGYTLDFARGLERAGIVHVLRDLPKDKAMTHDFPIVRPEHPQSQRVIDEICNFLKRQ